MRYSDLIFDLDGTVIDSFPTITEAFQRAVEAVYGHREQDERRLRDTIGLPLKESFRFYPETDRPALEAAYIRENDALQAGGVPYFAGVYEVLCRCKNAGIRLGIVTSKRRAPVERWLKNSRADALFSTVVAKEDTARHKPFGEPIARYLQIVGADKKHSIYFGDTMHDILCAHAAGIDCAVVGWTASDKEFLNKFSPKYWVNTPTDILKIAEGK